MNDRPVLSWRLAGLMLGSAPDGWPPGATGVMAATAAHAHRRLQAAPVRNRRVP
jgi:hypothetical protein